MSEFDALFRGELNSQGFGFQHAVVQQIHRHQVASWQVAATEFPVAYRERSTHIDVLAWCCNKRVLLVAECKRVNPAFGHWVFAHSPFTFERNQSETWLERLWPAGEDRPVAWLEPVPIRADPFHIALEVKTKQEGDASGLPKGKALSQALTQVSEGVNGLIQMLPQQKMLLREHGSILFVPAIFTTATLYTTDEVSLHLSDVKTGKMPDDATFESRPWLWFENNVSPNLLAEIQREKFNTATRFHDMLPARHSRAIAIVNYDGISNFLRALPNIIHGIVGVYPT